MSTWCSVVNQSLFAGGGDAVLVGVGVLGVGHGLQGGAEGGRPECLADPRIDQFQDRVYPDVEASGAGQGVGVLGGVRASVVVTAVVEAADHPPAAQAAEQQTGQGVPAFARTGFDLHVGAAGPGGDPDLDLLNAGGDVTWVGQTLQDVDVQIVGDAVAVLTAIVVDVIDRSGWQETFHLRLTQTWVNTVDGRQCLSVHAGPTVG